MRGPYLDEKSCEGKKERKCLLVVVKIGFSLESNDLTTLLLSLYDVHIWDIQVSLNPSTIPDDITKNFHLVLHNLPKNADEKIFRNFTQRC